MFPNAGGIRTDTGSTKGGLREGLFLAAAESNDPLASSVARWMPAPAADFQYAGSLGFRAVLTAKFAAFLALTLTCRMGAFVVLFSH
jgi:hypothetical protein